MIRVSFNEEWFKKATLKEVKRLYEGRSQKVQDKAEKFWRTLHPKKTSKKAKDEEE